MKRLDLNIKRYIANTEREDGENNIIGDLLINGEFFCYVLEDQLRAKGEKVYGETCIPAGTYKVVVDMSNRFKRLMPRLLNVPMFEGVRIHGGNTAKDSHGCPLIAFNTDGLKIWGSAEKLLTKKLLLFLEDNPGGEIFLKIENSFLTYEGNYSK